jgi:hypothetical protein
MKLTPVDSSHIAAIGYLEEERVLLVRYKDGSLYAHPSVTAAEWCILSVSETKGHTLPRLGLCTAILITKGGNAEDSQSKPERAAPLAVETPGPLNVIDEDADKCCRRQLTSFFGGAPSNAEHFECSACGTNFKPVMVGPSRHWRIVPLFAVHRMGK